MSKKTLIAFALVILLLTTSFAQQRFNGKVTVSGKLSSPTTGGGGGSDFVTDTFSEATNQNLESHVGELGATWLVHPAYAAAAVIDAATDRLYATATTAYYASGIPPSANYYAQADYTCLSIINTNVAVCVRMDISTGPAVDQMYSVRLSNGTAWELRKLVAGVGSTITSTTNQLPTVGQTKTVRLTATGTALVVNINGVDEISTTDPDITAAGRAGVRLAGVGSSSTGYTLDNFSAR